MELESLSNAIQKELPKIDGVRWFVDICREPASLHLNVRIVSQFKIDEDMSLREIVSQVSNKVHQITSGGQIRLEMER